MNDLCSPYRPRPHHGAPRSKPQAIVLLRHSDGTPWGSKPKDFKSYDGKGASKALAYALDRASSAISAANDCARSTLHLQYRARLLSEMRVACVAREQARESEAAE